MRVRIFQAAGWTPEGIIENIPEIASQNFTHILVGPWQVHKYVENDPWWAYYQPLDTDMEDWDTFTRVCAIAHLHGLKVIHDTVFQHVAGQSPLEGGNPLYPHKDVHPFWSHRDYLLPPIEHSSLDRYQFTHRCWGTPGVNLDHPDVQQRHAYFVNKLSHICDGLRIDMAKHIALPSEGCQWYPHMIQAAGEMPFFLECVDMNNQRNYLDQYADYGIPLTGYYETTTDTTKSCVRFEDRDTWQGEMGSTRDWTDDSRRYMWQQCCNWPMSLYYPRPFETLWKSPEVARWNLQDGSRNF